MFLELNEVELYELHHLRREMSMALGDKIKEAYDIQNDTVAKEAKGPLSRDEIDEICNKLVSMVTDPAIRPSALYESGAPKHSGPWFFEGKWNFRHRTSPLYEIARSMGKKDQYFNTPVPTLESAISRVLARKAVRAVKEASINPDPWKQ